MTKKTETVIDLDLLAYGTPTDKQKEIVEAVNKHGTIRAAARAMGIGKSTIQDSLAVLKRKACLKGYSPKHDMVHPVPDTHVVKGVSTYYDEDGKVKGQWVKSTLDNDQREKVLREFANALGKEVVGMAPTVPAPAPADNDLLCVIPMGDPHFGMYAWAQDAGADFDLDIAERVTFAAVDRLVAAGPRAGTAMLLNLGDMFHADNQKNVTQSGHQLDVDGRWPKVQQVGLMAMVHAIMRLLEKYPKVIFRINKGNHDGHSSYSLALMLSCWFRDEPRVTIDLSPAVMWYYAFGKVLLGSTHGDTIKGKDMLSIMAADKPAAWGASKFRHCLVGHVHHHDSKEYHGGIVEYFNTMAARDAWHQGQGYRAGRDMRLIVYHREFGEIERHRCDVGMIENTQGAAA